MGTTKTQQSMELARRLIGDRERALLGTINDVESVNMNRVKSEVEKEMPTKEILGRMSKVQAKAVKLTETFQKESLKLKEELSAIQKELDEHGGRVSKAIEERTRQIREQATALKHKAQRSAGDAYQKLYYDALTPSNRALVQEVPTPEEFVKEHNGIMIGAKVHALETGVAAG